MSTAQPLRCPPIMSRATADGLLSALHGAEQAARLYPAAADRLAEADLHVIAHAFRFTAAQEREHTAVLRGLILAHGGSIRNAPPEDAALPAAPLDLLDAAIRMEQARLEALPACAQAAQTEGFPRVAHALQRMAETENRHMQRFIRYKDALARGTLFRAERRVSWYCLSCGQLHTGCEPPEGCAGCGKGSGHFIRTTYFPFHAEG